MKQKNKQPKTTLINITPVAKPRMTKRDTWDKRPAVLKYWKFKDDIKKEDFKLADSYSVIFFMPFPESYSHKKKLRLAGTPHKLKPDLDNLLKALNDSFYKNDSHIHTINACKIWSFEGKIAITNLEL